MMQTGALIVAAGKSSRKGDFKPMLQLGSISIAQRVINNFRQAGISKIVVRIWTEAALPLFSILSEERLKDLTGKGVDHDPCGTHKSEDL